MFDQTETTEYCPQCGERHYWGEHTRPAPLALTVAIINRYFAGDPGNLVGKRVNTPAGRGPGKVQSVYSTRERGVYRAEVKFPGQPAHEFNRFNLDSLTLA